jgi:hypothetical protein
MVPQTENWYVSNDCAEGAVTASSKDASAIGAG